MNEYLAKLISFIFHPLLYPSYILLWLLNVNAAYAFLLPMHYKALLLALVFSLTFLIPVLIVYLLLKMKMIASFFLIVREERIFPLITTGILFYITYYFFKDLYLPRQFSLFMLSATLLILTSLLVNLTSKISLHMIAAGSVAGFFIFMFPEPEIKMLIWFFLAVIISGITGAARLRLRTHRPSEIYSGWALGFGGMILCSLLS